jgi:hypothetical protein
MSCRERDRERQRQRESRDTCRTGVSCVDKTPFACMDDGPPLCPMQPAWAQVSFWSSVCFSHVMTWEHLSPKSFWSCNKSSQSLLRFFCTWKLFFVVLLQIGKLKNPQRDEKNGLLASQSINQSINQSIIYLFIYLLSMSIKHLKLYGL